MRTGTVFDFRRHFAPLTYCYLAHIELDEMQNLNFTQFIVNLYLVSEKICRIVFIKLLIWCGLSQGNDLDLHFLVSALLNKKSLMELMVNVLLKLGLWRKCIFFSSSANICFYFSLIPRFHFQKPWAGNRSSSLYNPKNLLLPGS